MARPFSNGVAGIRSGRFKRDAPVTAIPIIRGISGAFYRIFNSGAVAFQVQGGGGSATWLDTTLSLDVVTNGNVMITATAEGKVEGIYECLDVRNSNRSGRFKLKAQPKDPVTGNLTTHKIIDFISGGAPPDAFYRIFNSGDNPFMVVLASESVEVAPEQSFDFAVTTKRDIHVTHVNVNDYPIEGIYEFLGSGSS